MISLSDVLSNLSIFRNNEALMIEDIVNEISKSLISSTSSRYLEGLIGMGAHTEKMKLLLCLGSDEVRIIGIWGPPGIGKSTIARVTYDQISNGFQLSAFMKMKPSYARTTCSDDHDVKLHLERQLLSQLTNQRDIEISHLGAAHNFLMDKKALVVLDGVDQLVQLDAMPEARCLGHGSRIIITTQNLKLLKAFEIEHIYQVDLPPSDEALQIFCMSAFGQSFPKDGFKNLACEVTTRAGRLPLGLRVMGSHFRGMSKDEWKRELPRLRIRLDGEIGSVLKFSYDALDDEDKDLFLLIACFFIDEGIYHIFEGILGNRFSDVRQGYMVLVQRSLISEPRWAISPMHNLLVQLGREIVRNQSINEPGKRQFLVDADEICEVLANNTGSRSIISINLCLRMIKGELKLSERAFEEMCNLQFLSFHDYHKPWKRLHLPQGLNYLPPKLKILRWAGYPGTCLPFNFDTKFLVNIVMEHSNLEKLWEGIQPLTNLKLMDLSYSTNLKELPDLSTATSLLRLWVVSCKSLVELPPSVGNLRNLQDLNLRECSNLVELPLIGNAKNLKWLNLRQCSSLMELPSSIGNAINLQELDLSKCWRLMKLPSSIANLINLEKLDTSSCSSLVELPSSIIEKIIGLQTLNLNECVSLMELPSSIGNTTRLQQLDLSLCSNLVKLPSSIGNLINLESLFLTSCSRLVELPSSIGNLVNIRVLRLCGCSNLVELPSSIGNLVNLKTLILNDCLRLVEIPCSIGNLTNLIELCLNHCSSLVELPSSIGNFIQLWILDLGGCLNLVKLPCSIGNLTNLQVLNLNHCSSLVELPTSIGNITKLRVLKLIGCSGLVELPSCVGNFINIEELDLNGCSNLVKLPHSSRNIINLKKLNLSRCSNLVSLSSFIRNGIYIQELNLNGCSSLVEIPSSIGNLGMLTKLTLQRCLKLKVLPININLGSLKELDVTGCSQLRSFPEISTNIERLMLHGTLIKEVPLSIKSWSRLRDLSITYCKDLEGFPHSRDIITELWLNNTEIEEVPPWVNGISRLRRLVLSKCRKLVSVPQRSSSLSSMDTENFESLERLICAFPNPQICLNYANIWKLNQKTRNSIFFDSYSGRYSNRYAILPGKKVPEFFTYRATTGGSLTVKLNQRHFLTSLRFKACVLLVYKGGKRAGDEIVTTISFTIVEIQNGRKTYQNISKYRKLHPLLTEHLYIFEEESVFGESSELLFEFEVHSNILGVDEWGIGECGIREVLEDDPDVDNFVIM